MHIRNKMFRTAAIILSIAFLATGLTACKNNVVVRPEGTYSADSAEPENSAAPLLESEVFAVGVKEALLDALEKSNHIGSTQLNLLFDPGAQFDNTQSNYTKSEVTLTNPEEGGDAIMLSMESVLDASSGDSSMAASVQSGSEVAQAGGIYFTGNTMLLRKADVEQPMIQHTLDPTVAESYKSLSAIERFNRVLSDTTKPKLSDEEWDAAIDAYLQTVTVNAQETNYVSEQQSVTLAGTEQDCTATTLTLSGEKAIDVARGLVSLIAQDTSFKSIFVSQYMISEDTYGVTGLDGVLRDIDALTPEERGAMTLTFKTLQGEQASAIYMSAATGQKTMSLLFKFFKDGYIRQNDIIFSGFDGSGVKISEQNTSVGGDNYTGYTVYENIAPGGISQEYSEISTKSTITDSQSYISTQLKYNRAASMEESATDISVNLDYSQQETSQGTNGSSTGVIAVTSDGEVSTINLSMTFEQINSSVSVSAPQFIPAAGVSTYDQASLYAALNDDLSVESFNRAPASARMLATLVLVFF